MKRKLFTLAALMSATLGLNAQQMVEVYSAYDVNQDTKVQVEDVTTVVNATLANSTAEDKTVVDAAKLNALLLDIYQKLESIDARLSALEGNKSNSDDEDEGTNDETGEGTNDGVDENGIIANGYEYVDLGLKDSEGRTIYWATCNVGADKPEDAGLYFAWGETVGYTSDNPDGRMFDWANYKWVKSGCTSWRNITKYTVADGYTLCDWYSNDEFIGDNKTVLDLEDDAAHVNWGGDWRMPTKTEEYQLRDKCIWTWDSKKKGYTVKGPNDNTIFLPAAGYLYNLSLYAESQGYYWLSTLSRSSSSTAYSLIFSSGNYFYEEKSRSQGRSVRAVCVAPK